jgi:hypothetical protein
MLEGKNPVSSTQNRTEQKSDSHDLFLSNLHMFKEDQIAIK